MRPFALLAITSFLAIPGMIFAADAVTNTGAAGPSRPVTFAKDVAPILQEKCQECHHKGAMAPMSLVSYEETRPWAKSIKQRVVARQMPPWHIDKTVGVQQFKNDMSLSEDQIGLIARWVDSGAPMGDAKDMPAAKIWPNDNEWKATKDLGAPDLVIKSEAYTMPAHGQDVWWRPATDIGLTEPRWVRAVEVRPGTASGRKITHHAVAYLVQDDAENLTPGADPSTRGYFMEWAIGKGYELYRPDTGRLILPGAKITWDVHLHAVGEELRDDVELGIWLYPKGQEPKHRTILTSFPALRGFQASIPTKGERNVDIPPNSIAQSDNYTVLKQAALLENFQPHMHLRGKAMSVEAVLPDGSSQMISYVGNFNFNWMTNYMYADDAAPILPKGTMIHVTAWYDNTKANPNNPDPDQWVGFGDRTVDEMGHAWMNVTYLSEAEYAQMMAERKAAAKTGTKVAAR